MPAPRDPAGLLRDAQAGNRLALARLLSMVERGGDGARDVDALVYPLAGGARCGAYTVGITGAPGAGKSTLTSELLKVFRRAEPQVAVLAVDPSSPYTGGAILGDRVRMGEHHGDDGVYIRSMATRGHMGGLSLATPQAVRVLDAAGWGWVLVETVGVGQVEVEVAGAADTTVVVVNPGWGDAVQANKAGLMEIADVFVVNKADRPGVDETRRDILAMVELSADRRWDPPVVATVGPAGEGVEELHAALLAHREHLERCGELAERRAKRTADELGLVLQRLLHQRIEALGEGSGLAAAQAQVVAGELDPYSAAQGLLSAAG